MNDYDNGAIQPPIRPSALRGLKRGQPFDWGPTLDWLHDFPWAMLVMLALFVGVVLLTILAVLADDKACREAGGRTLSKPITGVGVSSSGDVVPTFSSVSFCVTPDGRIIR